MHEIPKEPVVFLTKLFEGDFQFLEVLKDQEFVSTESKLKVFIKLFDIIESANPNKEKRLVESGKPASY